MLSQKILCSLYHLLSWETQTTVVSMYDSIIGSIHTHLNFHHWLSTYFRLPQSSIFFVIHEKQMLQIYVLQISFIKCWHKWMIIHEKQKMEKETLLASTQKRVKWNERSESLNRTKQKEKSIIVLYTFIKYPKLLKFTHLHAYTYTPQLPLYICFILKTVTKTWEIIFPFHTFHFFFSLFISHTFFFFIWNVSRGKNIVWMKKGRKKFEGKEEKW